MPFYLGWIYKKGQCTNFFFQVSSSLSNMFTHYIQNLEIYNAFIISEPEFTVCSDILRVLLQKYPFPFGSMVECWTSNLGVVGSKPSGSRQICMWKKCTTQCEFWLRNDKSIIYFQILDIMCKNVRKTSRNSKKKFVQRPFL